MTNILTPKCPFGQFNTHPFPSAHRSHTDRCHTTVQINLQTLGFLAEVKIHTLYFHYSDSYCDVSFTFKHLVNAIFQYWLTLHSRYTFYSFFLSLGVKPMTLVLLAPALLKELLCCKVAKFSSLQCHMILQKSF